VQRKVKIDLNMCKNCAIMTLAIKTGGKVKI